MRSPWRQLLLPLCRVGLCLAAGALAAAPSPEFENDVSPLLSRHGCNGSSCHGKAEGQNGFRLSVFGYDAAGDHAAITLENRGRRLSPAAPEQSLLLRKAAGEVPHEGGRRFAKDSADYRLIRDWIAAGAPLSRPDSPRLEAITLAPREQVMAPGATLRLRVTARFSDASERDVTALAMFHSNNEALGSVNEAGVVTIGNVPGQVAVMTRYQGRVDVLRVLIPRPGEPVSEDAFTGFNFIDRHVNAHLRKLNLQPSALADDATFLRRAHLDIIGTLPTAAEARRFLASEAPDRRAKLVRQLLARPEFADYWALKWADLLRVDRQKLDQKEAYAYYRWIREQFAGKGSLATLARELVSAEGPLDESPAGHFYKAVNKPGEIASTLSQVFLGVRIACAECHHHPFDRWSQGDFQGMTAFFKPARVQKGPFGDMLVAEGNPATRHPRTGESILPHALGTEMPAETPDGDPRRVLADWLAAPDNPWFARNLANRLVAHFFGRGLVEPVDDLRATNPPGNPELLDALAAQVTESGFDLRRVIETITSSRTYQLSATPNETNAGDEQNYSRALLRRVPAEVLFDAVCQVTGVPEKFDGQPAGARAIQLWDNQVPHYFLRLFGRPARTSACECERNADASIAQVLHFLNSPEIQSKLGHEAGRIARLAASPKDPAALADELYLTCFSRFPNAAERANAVKFLAQSPTRRAALEDLAWSLLNSLEFVFNH